MVVIDNRDSRWLLLLVETAGGVVIVGRDSCMINVLVVQYCGLTRGVLMGSQVLILV